MNGSEFFNGSHNVSVARGGFSYDETVFQVAILVVVLIIATLGNGFVMYCVFAHKNLQVPTNYFIVSLAAADFLFAILALPFRIYDIKGNHVWLLSVDTCRFWVWLDLFFCSASVANLASISVDRYMKISAPLTYNTRMTRRRVLFILILLWGYSSLLASLSLVQWSSDPRDQARGVLVDEYKTCRNDAAVFLTIISTLGFFVPLAIMFLMYFFVFKVAVVQATRVAKQQESINGVSKKRRKRRARSSIALLEVKATKTLIILLSVFCVCWCPYFILSLIGIHKIELYASLPLWFLKILKMVFVNFLPNLNAALDPIVYTTNNHQFRTVIRRMFRRQRERARSIISSNIYSDGGFISVSEFRSRRGSSIKSKTMLSSVSAKLSLVPLQESST